MAKTISDIKAYLDSVGAGSNPEVGGDPVSFLIRHYDYLARRVAKYEAPGGEFFALRDPEGGVIWEGSTDKKVGEPEK